MGLFSCADAIAKTMTGSLPAIELAWMRYLSFAAISVTLALSRNGPAVFRTAIPGLQIMRGIALISAAILFISGTRLLSLPTTTAIHYMSPLFTTVLAIPLLGERVGRHRWAAVFLGLIGILIVVRPSGGEVQLAFLFPVCSATCWATVLILTRRIGHRDGIYTTLVYSALTGVGFVSLLTPWEYIAPTRTEWMLGLFTGVVTSGAHVLLIKAFRYADASLLAPFSYVQVLWATVLGYIMFGSFPDRWTFLGATIIISSGLYSGYRERQRSKPPRLRAV